MADKIVRIVADTSRYQKGINDAKKSVNGFKSAGNAGSKAVTDMVGSFRKMVPALSVATTGLAALKKSINATQTTADAYCIAMSTMKGVTDNFFTSISQGSLGLFVRNLKEASTAAREAAKWVDQFGNTKMSYNYVASFYREQIQEQRAVIGSESGASPSERQAAAAELNRLLAEWKSSGEVYEKAALETLKAGISSKSMGLIGADQIDGSTIDQIFKIDAQADYAEQRKELAARYSEYTERLKRIEGDFQAKMAELGPAGTTNSAGLPMFQDSQYMATVNKLKAEAEAAKRALAAEYEKPIVFNALLEVDTDEELQQAMATMQEVYNSQKLIERTAKTINSDIKQMNADLAKTATVARDAGLGLQQMQPKAITTMLQTSQQPAIENGPVVGATASLNALTEKLDTQQLDEYNSKLAAIAANRERIDSLGSAFTQLGYAMAGSGNDALAAAGSILAMVAQVVPAMTTLFAASSAAGTAEAVAETPTLAGKIAALATVTAGIISMVTTFKNLQFAEGGIVPGSNFTDGITARVSSGEMVLNAHDQRNLYESIKGGNIGGGGRSYVTGEQLVTVINNYGRRTGRGEILK